MSAHYELSQPCKECAPDVLKNERGEGISVYSRANLYGRFTADPDKSITVRAVLLGAVASGKTVIKNPLVSGDTLAALREAGGVGQLRGLTPALRLAGDLRGRVFHGRGLCSFVFA